MKRNLYFGLVILGMATASTGLYFLATYRMQQKTLQQMQRARPDSIPKFHPYSASQFIPTE